MPKNGVNLLSDYAGGKIIVTCACGISRRYSADAMQARLGDRSMNDVLILLGRALGCDKAGKTPSSGDIRANRCHLKYDIERMKATAGRAG